MRAGNVFQCAISNAGSQYQASGYQYRDPYGRVYTIGSDGTLQSLKDLNGNTLTVGPGGITSSTGLNIPFVRDAQGRITQITDATGNNVYKYVYDPASGNLSTVTLPGIANPTTYAYDTTCEPPAVAFPNPTHLLTCEKDPVGNTGSTTYYTDGKLKSITDAANQTTSYVYDVANLKTTVTNPDGGTVVTVADAYGMPTSVTESLTSTTSRTRSYTYDASHNKTSEANPLGQITLFGYDSGGFLTSKKDPAPLNFLWTIVNNSVGGPVSIKDPVNPAQTLTYDNNFNPASITDSIGQVAAFTYTAQGLPQTLVDANGNTSSYLYDAFGNRTRVTDQINRATNTVYNNMGWMTSQTDPRLNATQFGYDALGRKTSMTDSYGKITSYVYDGNNNKTSETNARGFTTTYQYDAVNRMTKVTYPDASFKTYTYDFRGNKVTEVDQLGRTTKYVYDLAGQMTSMTVAFGTADAATTSYTYDLAGRKLTQTDPRGNLTTNTYDEAGRMTSMKDGVGNLTHYGYDGKGQRTSMIDAKNRTTAYAFDARGRVTSTLTPDGKTVSKTYDGMGSVTSVTDEDGRTTSYTYDGARQLTQVKDALNQLTIFGYDPSGNKTSQQDANNHTTTYVYDKLNRRTSRKLPAGQMETMGYDEVGNKTSYIDFNGKTTTYGYDTLNRLLSKTPDASFAAAPIRFTYTLTGKRASMVDPTGTTTYTYTNRDQVLKKTTPQGALSYAYDLSGNVASVLSSNTNGTSVGYSWDADNRLSSVTDNRTSGVTNYTYDQTSQLSTMQYPNTVKHAYGYDTRDRTTSLGVTAGATTLASYGQVFGASGHKTNVTESSGRAPAYQYDQIWRLTQESITGDPVAANNGVLTYGLDPVGNRLSLTSTLGALPNQTFSFDLDDRLQSDIYDANGNTLTSGSNTYAYQFEDRLTNFNNGAVTMVYDGDGNRVIRTTGGTTVRYLIDEKTPTGYMQIAEELLGGSVVVQFTYGSMRISQNRAGAVSYYGYDSGASVRELIDGSGTTTDSYSYDAFGNTVAQTGPTTNEFLYRGEQFDAFLGLYNLRARYYKPITGRFLTADKLGTGAVISACDCKYLRTHLPVHHSYRYGRANPVGWIDPTGNSDLIETSLTSVLASPRKIIAVALIGVLFVETIHELVECVLHMLESIPPEDGPEVAPALSPILCIGHEHQEFLDPTENPLGPTVWRQPWMP